MEKIEIPPGKQEKRNRPVLKASAVRAGMCGQGTSRIRIADTSRTR